jgi:hypothetical protein
MIQLKLPAQLAQALASKQEHLQLICGLVEKSEMEDLTLLEQQVKV